MGHAGAIVSAVGDTAAEKAEIMRGHGLLVAPSAARLGATSAPGAGIGAVTPPCALPT